ncbi:RNA polymerase II transcription factor B subunit 2-like isoform X2 [Asparagus officinalis]|uniref:RNA polymerase II transcription factor B subunit 2-like isoform X2 n=1 Tax=Asparagus officinalis TaxID=4686 RepID=UPI00098E6585|nr:RNA polymerase II transcription factor B subunit 2-like isoform X2 [Asparagus officinalis]
MPLSNGRENEAATLIKYGFQFLLMETNAQLWYIVGEYISSSEDCGVDPTDLILFLLELSFHTMGKDRVSTSKPYCWIYNKRKCRQCF